MERHKIVQKKYVKILCKQEKPDVEGRYDRNDNIQDQHCPCIAG